MKYLFTLVVSAFYIVAFSQQIQNGNFESGSTPNNIDQIGRADFWHIGCDGSTDLYDCQADPIGGDGPLSGSIIVGTPAACINPRYNGSNNCRLVLFDVQVVLVQVVAFITNWTQTYYLI